MNISCIIVDKPIPGITGPAYSKCTNLADVLAALAAVAGVDIHAVSGVYNPATEDIEITLSNGGIFSIPATLLLPVVADGTTITGNGTTGSPLIGYKLDYNPTTGDLTITAPGGTPIVIAQQTATTEPATDTQNLLGGGPGSTVTTQQLLDALAAAIQIPAGAGLRNATATALANNVAKNPAFAQITHQQNAVATTGANSNIAIQLPGRYLFTASIWWASENWTYEAGMHGLVRVNGTIVYYGGREDHNRKLLNDPVNGGVAKFLSYSTQITCILSLVAGDVVDLHLIHDDSTNHNLLTNAGYSWMQLEKLT